MHKLLFNYDESNIITNSAIFSYSLILWLARRLNLTKNLKLINLRWEGEPNARRYSMN